ncbi:MAG TPA: hypothetical protein VF754_05295, partial [Pyrinomonadaceae bacterium]
VEHVTHERTPTRAVQIGSFSRYRLKYAEEADWVFRGFAEALKTDAQLSAYLIVRLPYTEDEARPPATEGEATEQASEPDPEEPPEVDLTKLVEKWKADLKKQYNIGDERLVVLVVPAREQYDTEGVETWVVPKGAQPPDPYANPEEEAAEASAEETGEETEETGEAEETTDEDEPRPPLPRA